MPLFYDMLDINVLKNDESLWNVKFLLNGAVFIKYLRESINTGYISLEKLMKVYLSTNLTRVLFLKEQLCERLLKSTFCALIPVNMNTKAGHDICEQI